MGFSNDVIIDIKSNEIEIQSDSFKNSYKIDDFNVYKLVDEYDNVSAVHLLPKDIDDEITLILYSNYDASEKILEFMNYGTRTNVFLKEITSHEYNYLTANGINVLYTSPLGEILRCNQGKFESLYYDSENETQTSTFALDRGVQNVADMTKTDEYLDPYIITESSYAFGQNICDNIIHIVPENWFFQVGIKTYVGNEYAIYKKTIFLESAFYPNTFKTTLTVFDIDFIQPSTVANVNQSTIINNLEGKFTIKPTINYTYNSFDSSFYSPEFWVEHFDRHEERIVTWAKDSVSYNYIAPTEFGFGIDDYRTDEMASDSDKNSLLGMGIEKVKYTFKNNISSNPNENSSTIFFDTMVKIIGMIKTEGKIISALMSLVDKVTTYIEDNRYNDNVKNLTYNANGKSREVNYGEFKNGNYYYPLMMAVNLPSFTNVFSNSLLNSFEHEIDILFSPSGAFDFTNYGYSIITSMNLNFYDQNGNYASSESYDRSYDNVARTIMINPSTVSGMHFISNGSSITQNFTGPKEWKNILFESNRTGLFYIKTNNLSSYKIEIYEYKMIDENGNFEWNEIRSRSSNNDICYVPISLKTGKHYVLSILCNDANNTSVSLSFNQINNNIINLTNERSISINMNGEKTRFVRYNAVEKVVPPKFETAVYDIRTISNYDTTIRVYNGNMDLLIESNDPFADWSEDMPDLNAGFSLLPARLNYNEIVLDGYNNGVPNYKTEVIGNKILVLELIVYEPVSSVSLTIDKIIPAV